jgi:hypothetical protein
MLNLKNGSYSSRWNFKADPSLKPGKGKITVGIFEMKDFMDEGGKRKQFRPLIIAEDRDIILY